MSRWLLRIDIKQFLVESASPIWIALRIRKRIMASERLVTRKLGEIAWMELHAITNDLNEVAGVEELDDCLEMLYDFGDAYGIWWGLRTPQHASTGTRV